MTNRRYVLRLLAAGAAAPRLSRSEAPKAPEVRAKLGRRRLYIVPFSHTDWAWVNSRAWMIDRHAAILSDVLDILKEHPDFRFYIESWNEQLEAFLARRPDRIMEMRHAMNGGRVAVCAATCNQHPGWMETESLVRDLVMGRRLFHEFAPQANLDALVKPDVTPGPSQMPQILAKAGYRYYGINRPDGTMTRQGIPRQFVWKGLDGSTILVDRDGGCGFIHADALLPDFSKQWDEAVERLYAREVSEHSDARSKNVTWLPLGCDDSRPLRSWQAVPINGKLEEFTMPIVAFMKEWNRREDSHMQFGTPLDVFHELEKGRDTLPVHEGVVDPAMWTFWYGLNGNQGLRLWRTRADRALVCGEKFWACAAAAGLASYPERQYETLWRDLLRVYSHAQMWLFAGDYATQLHRAKTTLSSAEDLRDEAVAKIAAHIAVDERRSYIALFNELPWERTEVVPVWIQLQDPAATNVRASDAQGRPVELQVEDVNWYERAQGSKYIRELKAFIKATVPALGYTTIYFDSAPGTLALPVASRAETIDTATATLHLSGRGIDLLEDKRTGARYTGAGDLVFNQTTDNPKTYHYAPVDKTHTFSGRIDEIITGPLRSTFRLSGALGQHRATVEGAYDPHNGRLSLKTVITAEAASGHFMTTVGLPAEGKLDVDVHFGVEARDVRTIDYRGGERMRKNVFYGGHWCRWTDGRNNLTLVGTTGEKGFEYDPSSKRLGHYLLMTIPRDTTTWERFVTQAREGTGEHAFDCRILLHAPGADLHAISQQAMEAQHPLLPVMTNRLEPKVVRTLPPEHSFLSAPDVQLSAFYRDRGRTLLRVYEPAGRAGTARITLPKAPKSVREVDFNGSPRPRRIGLSGNAVNFAISRWEIVTLEIIG